MQFLLLRFILIILFLYVEQGNVILVKSQFPPVVLFIKSRGCMEVIYKNGYCFLDYMLLHHSCIYHNFQCQIH